MKSSVFLRIASVLTLIHSAMHTIGGVFGKAKGAAAQAAASAMQSNQFPVMGLTRSYADFYRGMGLAVTIFLAAEAIVFWQLSSVAEGDALRLRPILATFFIAYLVLAINSFRYFFFGPVVVEILIALCLGLAMMNAKRSSIA